ncbi:hypothetical protein FHETE_2511 [Fusarium heterosporum]|uniref:Uncharacterized protein n=1 Tax=Fusarium heterosporum TaxID=42747 RepID=A0A8H5WXG0_FUSHE|nr:hypothetical protein FHETE_2511 [Fusarium heterosporum]
MTAHIDASLYFGVLAGFKPNANFCPPSKSGLKVLILCLRSLTNPAWSVQSSSVQFSPAHLSITAATATFSLRKSREVHYTAKYRCG